MKLTQLLKSAPLFGATLLALGAAAAPALARSHVPILGRALVASEHTCFSEWYGTIYNNGSCGTAQRSFLMPLVTDHATTYNAMVSLYSPGASSPLSCQLFGVDKEAVGLWTSPSVNVPQYGSSQDITLSAYVPWYGSAYVACSMGANARINMVNY